VQELSRRAATDSRHACSWELKRNVAQRLLRLRLVRRDAATALESQLSEEQQAHVLRSHPLLHRPRPGNRGPPAYRQEEWFKDIRRKVETYVASREAGG
jgi:hypothetical protein